MIELLLNFASNPMPHNGMYGALHMAAYVDDRVDILRALITTYREKGIKHDIDLRESTFVQNTPLSIAVAFGNYHCAVELMELGANSSVTVGTGTTLLHNAVSLIYM